MAEPPLKGKPLMQNEVSASVQDMVADVIQQRTAAGDPNFVGKSQNDLEIEANIEITSDFIGENCFGGKNSLDGFLESLQPEQRKTFIQRILDFLRSILDRIAGDKTLEDDITRIEKQFVKAYKAVEVSQQQKTPTKTAV